MNYNEALNFIYQKQSLGMMPGLSRIQRLLKKMGNPQNDYKVIHIAGTNGKGTVAATIAKALQDSGYQVGLFTSPWVTDYREQIQINGEYITKERFASYITRYADTDCTEFELLTAVMYRYFADEKVDYAVVECGMGGRGDATNVEENNLSVITAISLDHTDFLGATLDEIAEEKSGVCRKNCTCVLFDEALQAHFKPKCQKLITGGFACNLDLVNAALRELNVPEVSELVKLPARQERIGAVLLDGGHNVAAAQALAPLLHQEIAVIGMLRDKDADGYLSLIAPHCQKIIATTPDSPRAMNAADLCALAKKYCADVTVIENPVDAVKEQGITLVCGSFYLAREVRKFL